MSDLTFTNATAIDHTNRAVEGHDKIGNGYLGRAEADAPLVFEALNGLMSETDPQRNDLIKQATDIMVNNGELQEVFLMFGESEGLQQIAKLGGDNDDQIGSDTLEEWNALKSAAETGSYTYKDKDGVSHTVTLSVAEQIAARALLDNFEALNGDDTVVSLKDINNMATGKSNMQDDFSEEHFGAMDIAMAFANADGSFNEAAFKQIFGSSTGVMTDDIKRKLADPEANLTPVQRRALEHMVANFGVIAGQNKEGNPSLIEPSDLWPYASAHGVNYVEDTAALKAREDALAPYETALQEGDGGAGGGGAGSGDTNGGNSTAGDSGNGSGSGSGDNGNGGDDGSTTGSGDGGGGGGGGAGGDGSNSGGGFNSQSEQPRKDNELIGLLKHDDGEPDAFAIADTDGSGSVSAEEAKALYENQAAMKQLDERQRAAVTNLYVHFNDLDTDKDGEITIQELQTGSSFEGQPEAEMRENIQAMFVPLTPEERKQLISELFSRAPALRTISGEY